MVGFDPLGRQPPACVPDEEGRHEVQALALVEIVVPEELPPHAHTRLAESVLGCGGIDGDGQSQLGKDEAGLGLEGRQALLVGLGAFGVALKRDAALVADDGNGVAV